MPGIVQTEVQPAGDQCGDHREHQEHVGDGMAGDHRLLVEPGHAVVADVEPAVDARGRPGQDEQQSRHVQRQIAPRMQTHTRKGECRDRSEGARQPRENAELDGPLGGGEGE
ncbi:Uncharacterised protein [Mycobacteroides abscessus subsp. massiliense]|nr:Uncharacterised protein [Mycobacteroides abscessus subsp. massiliense]